MESRPVPKPRIVKLEAHVLAYLGDFMNVYEESVKRLAAKAAQDLKPSTQKRQGSSPASQWYIAFSHNPS